MKNDMTEDITIHSKGRSSIFLRKRLCQDAIKGITQYVGSCCRCDVKIKAAQRRTRVEDVH